MINHVRHFYAVTYGLTKRATTVDACSCSLQQFIIWSTLIVESAQIQEDPFFNTGPYIYTCIHIYINIYLHVHIMVQ